MDSSGFENMDKRFQNLDNEVNFTSSSQDWESAEQMLDNAFLDDAFVNAAALNVVEDTKDSVDFDSVDDAFMNQAFIDAIENTTFDYNQSYYKDFQSKESELVQDNSFLEASSLSSITYKKEFWGDADKALQAEGLHYQYSSSYWKEAEKLLNKETRRAFFYRWSAVAGLLLLLSFAGFKFNTQNQIDNNLKLSKNNTQQVGVINKNGLDNKDLNQADKLSNKVQSVIATGDVVNSNSDIVLSEQSSNSFSNNLKDFKVDPQVDAEDNSLSDLIVEVHENVDSENDNQTVVINSKADIDKIKLISPKESISSLVNEYSLGNMLPIDLKQPNKVFATHNFGVKISKGLGNNFENTTGMLSARNSGYLEYSFVPHFKLTKFEFGANLGVYHMNLNNYEYENNYSVYHNAGDVDHYWYKMTYKDLVFLSSNFSAYYNINGKHKINVNIGFDRLVTSRINSEYKEVQELAVDNGSEWGINKGVNRTDVNFGVGYELALSSKFSFTFDSNIGLIDKTNNDYLERVHDDRDLSFMLGLKYNLFSIKR
jgi:hypothetical protein